MTPPGVPGRYKKAATFPPARLHWNGNLPRHRCVNIQCHFLRGVLIGTIWQDHSTYLRHLIRSIIANYSSTLQSPRYRSHLKRWVVIYLQGRQTLLLTLGVPSQNTGRPNKGFPKEGCFPHYSPVSLYSSPPNRRNRANLICRRRQILS